jgi:hypothetical protein
MRHDTRSKIVWASWMTGGAVALSLLAWVVTESLGWTFVTLLAAGPVLNAIAQMVVQPARAVRRATRPDHQGDSAR